MPRANIDLSWLASLLTKTPQATPNDMYGAQQEQPYVDPVTGNSSSAPAYTDRSGNEIPGTLPKGADTTSAFVRPSKWQEMVKPEASAAITSLNNQFAARPALARLDDQTKLAIAQEHISKLPAPYQIPGLDTEQQALVGMGERQTPVEMGQQIRAGGDVMAGVPSINTSTDIATAQSNLTAAKAGLNRQPVVEAALDQQSVNELARLTRVDPQKISLDAENLKREIGRNPTVEEVRDYVAKNNLNAEQNIVPFQQDETKQNAILGAKIGRARVGLFPYTEQTLKNSAVSDLVQSSQIPLGAPRVNTINPDGTVTRLAKNSYGMSPMALQIQLANELGQSVGAMDGMDQVKGPSGATYYVKKKPVNQIIDPLNPTPSTVAKPATATVHTDDRTVLSDNNGNPPPPFLPETQGSVRARVQDSIETIKNQLNDTDLQERARMYPSSEYGKRYAALKAQLEELMKQQTTPNVGGVVRPSRMSVGSFTFPKGLQ